MITEPRYVVHTFLVKKLAIRTTLAVLILVLLIITISQTRIAASVIAAFPASSLNWPTTDQWRRVVLLQDYNTRVVVLGTAVLGCAAGMVGSFTLLRRRALMGDALSHASLPGIAIAFLIGTALGIDGKAMPLLLAGATISGMVGVLSILAIRNLTRLKEDTALGIVLSVFFGAGVVLLGIVTKMDTGHAAGLESFIYGKTASMTAGDVTLIVVASIASIVACSLLFKEFKLLCFDEGFAASRGKPVVVLDMALMFLVVTVSIVGLQAVGLILMIALLVIPAAAARFWTENMSTMTLVSAALGAISGVIGAAASALFSRLPSGATIVLVCAAFFAFSLVFAPARGVLLRTVRRQLLNLRVQRQHLLRAIYESLENDPAVQKKRFSQVVGFDQLLPMRSWSRRSLREAIYVVQAEGLAYPTPDDGVRLTKPGIREAARLTREHRLWELYLIHHADIAPSRVDRDADRIEHVLEPELIDELEELLRHPQPEIAVPISPHKMSVGVEDANSGTSSRRGDGGND